MAFGSSSNFNRLMLLLCWLLENHTGSVAFHQFVYISKTFILPSDAYLLTIRGIKFIDKEKFHHWKANKEGKVPTDSQGTITEKCSFEKKEDVISCQQ